MCKGTSDLVYVTAYTLDGLSIKVRDWSFDFIEWTTALSNVLLLLFFFCYFSLEEFHQHMVLAYAENIFVILRYIWPPESKSEWCKCVHVEHSEIWVKKCIFWSKNMILARFKAFTLFFLSMRIDNNFLITISDDLTTYLLKSVYFRSKISILSIFGSNAIFTFTQGM